MVFGESIQLRLVAAACLLTLLGCGGEPAGEPQPPTPPPGDYLAVPFTAEQIRDEWTVGLTLVLHFRYPEHQEWQRWTVVETDPDGATIEYLPLDGQGQPTGPPERARNTWTDLRDHALFPATESRRERLTRETVLGELEGWLYRVHDSEAETMTRFFFADELPGAPVWMETRSGERPMLTVTQIARQHLAGPPAGGPETVPAPG